MVDEVLVAQRDPPHPLADQRAHLMLDQCRRARIAEAAGEPLDQPDRPIRGAQQQCPGVRCDRPAIERSHDGTAFDACKSKQIRATLCRHRGISLDQRKLLWHNKFLRVRAPMHLTYVRYPG